MKKIVFIILIGLFELGFSLRNSAPDKTYSVDMYNTHIDLDKTIRETSGLVWTDDGLWTINDSKNAAAMYRIDTVTGDVLQTVNISNYSNVDWEDIAADSNFIYIGDIGNNDGVRKDLRILKVRKSDISSQTTQTVTAEAINFSYPDQVNFNPSSNSNYNAEALLSYGDSLYIFTKNHGDYQTRMYRISKFPGTYAADLLDTFDADGLITGADISPDGKEVMLLGYAKSHTNSYIWFLSEFKGDRFFSGVQKRVIFGDFSDWQTEGIAYQNNENIWLSNEQTTQYPQRLYHFQKSDILEGKAGSVQNVKRVKVHCFPNPSNGIISFKLDQNQIPRAVYFVNLEGRRIDMDVKESGPRLFQTMEPIQKGVYFFVVEMIDGERFANRVVVH